MLLIKSNKETLLKPLQTVTGIVENRNTSPILSNVLIQQDSEEISFLTTDLEIQIKTVLKNTSTTEPSFSLTVSAKKFQDILRSLTENTEIILIQQEHHLQVKAGKSIFSLQILPAEDFPKVSEETEPEVSITLKQKDFKKLLQQTQFSIAHQDIRYYLNGLLLLIEDSYLKSAATDGHRLAYSAINLEESNVKKEIILPRKAVLEVAKLLNDSDEPVKIEFIQNKIRFSFSNVILTSKVIDGKFPDYNRVIPTQNTKQFDLDRLTFLQALQRVSILSNLNEKFRGVHLIISSGNLRIICKNNEQEEAQEEIEIQYEHETIDISLNITYLIDLLNNISSKKILCFLNDANSSILITIPENKEFKYILMPMRI